MFRGFCDDCEVKKNRNKFKQTYEANLKSFFGRVPPEFDFEKMVSILYSVLPFRDTPKDEITVKTYQLLEIYNSEKYRKEAIDDFNNK